VNSWRPYPPSHRSKWARIKKPPEPAIAPTIDLDFSVFDGIRDKTGVIPSRAYFHLLDVARRTPTELLDSVARHDRTFAHFVRTPDRLRGEPVYLKGRLERLTETTTRQEGFDRLYEGWLFTEESQGNPYGHRLGSGLDFELWVISDSTFAAAKFVRG